MKAVAALGSARPMIHDRREYGHILEGIRERLKRFDTHRRVVELGIMENWDNYVKQLSACRNFSRMFSIQKANEFYGPDVYKTFKRTRIGCPSCFTPDKETLEITAGPYKGFRTTTTSYFTSYSVGHLFALNSAADKTAAVRMTDMLDRMGIDMFSFCAMLDFLVTESEKGDLDPMRFEIALGRDMDSLLCWTKAISMREGKAEILSEGWRSLLAELGEGFRQRAPLIKDLDVIWDPRLAGLGTMEFEQIVSLKGPRSASGGSPTYIPGQPEKNLQLFAKHLDRMGADKGAIERIMDSPLGFNVGRMARYSEDWYTTLSSLGICNRHFVNRFYSFDLCRRMFVSVTGFEVGQDRFRESIAAVWNIIKEMNLEEGFGPEADLPPELWFTPMEGADGSPMAIRDYFGRKELARDEISELVLDYYDERGWASPIH